MAFVDFFRDRFFWVPAVVATGLMILALHFNINPVEGSVVPRAIQGTGIDVFLFVTCIPAWILGYIIGYLISFLYPVSFSLMVCVAQFLCYGMIGKLAGRGYRSLRARRRG